MSKKQKKREATKALVLSIANTGIPKDETKVDVIIPVFNNLKLLKMTVESAKKYGGERLGEFIFVDDCSSEPGIKEYCESQGRYYRNSVNKGFAASCNYGVRRSATNYFVLLNSDTEATEGWLDALIEMMDSNKLLVVVGPLLLFPEDSNEPTRPAGKVQSCGFAYGIYGQPYHRLITWSRDNQKVQLPRTDLQGITGACWLVRREYWKKLEGFFEEYGSYFEDSDFCIRARMSGYKIGYQPKSVLYHRVGASWTDKRSLTARNKQIFLQRCNGLFRYDEYFLV